VSPPANEDEWDEEAWEDDTSAEEAPGAGAPAAWRTPAQAPRAGGMSLGFLAMLPLFAVYEGGPTAELALFRLLAPLGSWADSARWLALLLAAAAAATVCYRRRLALVPGIVRVVGEGLLVAALLGPALTGLFMLLGETPPGSGGPADATPSLGRGALVFGGAAYEELLFRVLLFGLLFLVAGHVARFLGLGRRGARLASEVGANLGSAIAFAAFHLAAFTHWLGVGGERFDAEVFTWRLLAGILLALVFRWRGAGVAAWAH